VRRLLWILLAVLTVALLVLVLQQNETALAELSRFDSASWETKVMAAALVGLIALILFRQRFSRVFESALIWLMLAALLALGYTYRFELREVADRVLAEFIPGRPVTRGRTVEIARTSSSASRPTASSATPTATARPGSPTSSRSPRRPASSSSTPSASPRSTRCGRARAAPVTLDRLSIGGISERSVPALIAQPGQLRTSLLGMTFLNRLESWEVRGDKLMMRGYP